MRGCWRACKRNAAAVRYWIWFVASVKFLVPLALLQQLGDRLGRSLPEPLPVDAALVESASAVFVPAMPRDLVTSDAAISQVLLIGAAIWALGAALLFLRWFPAVVLDPRAAELRAGSICGSAGAGAHHVERSADRAYSASSARS